MKFDFPDMNLQDFAVFTLNGQLDITLAWLILASSGLLLLLAALLLNHGRRKFSKRLNQMQDLQNDLRAITAAAIGVGERVLELERRQRRLSERQEQLDNYDPANLSYEQAIRMVKNGAAADELVDVCGLSESEAELVTLMHRLDQTA